MILFLDDDVIRRKAFRSRVPSATIVETAADCIQQLRKHAEWDLVCLDHDLNGETYCDSSRKDCGAEVVRWMVEHLPTVHRVIVHSYNVAAAEAMVTALDEAGFWASYYTFNSMPFWLAAEFQE